MKKRLEKLGVSPVIATVLLVAMVIVIALIIFLWFRGIAGETCTKFEGTNVELVCGDASFSAEYSYGTFRMTNTGNVPIYSLKIRINEAGSHRTVDIRDLTNWPDSGLSGGNSFSGNMDVSVAETLLIIPVLMTTCGGYEKAYSCNEDQHGYEIPVL
mgnify:FL=1